MLLDDGTINPIGKDLIALVIDCSVGILNYINFINHLPRNRNLINYLYHNLSEFY